MSVQQRVLTPEEVWRKYDAMEARLSAPLSERMLDLARIGPGMRVLDLATGRGEPAIAAAHRVGPNGLVVGVDVSESMLAMARERAEREGIQNLDLRTLDAASPDEFPAEQFDAVLLRWGLMYMQSPVAALVGAQRAMVPGAALVVAVFAEPERVPYFSLPRRVLERYRPVPPIDFSVPGTFFYSDEARLRRDLELADLRLDHVEEFDVAVMEAVTASELVDWVRAFGLTRLLGDLSEAAQQAWEADLVREAEHFRENGVVRLGGVTRIFVASKLSSTSA